ncbi:hypothetical protein HZ992_24700 [Rhizobacter sp. AJA081-3]|uniref:hypothetical protein n=1 Tax=Rhizobacter sp. AJA081-3 TaxID=2753607 RepID=UPI001AE0CB3E|nr:hypothetical protein [Rhizobacter sp. AJA081-3]QTN23266.1 hypothetical protein HZ992_24700 [Rhizobacter sp. AJA081-3]
MTQKHDKKTAERRSGTDRRRADKGPPGRVDRRRVVEPRKPEVAELDVSDSEWGALTEQAFSAPPAKKPPQDKGS